VLQGGITVVLIILLVGCGRSAPVSVSEAPAATTAPEQAATPTTEPATPTPEPSPTTEGESAVDPVAVGDPERGREIFENGNDHENFKPSYFCIRCHSLDGSDGYRPSLQGISQRVGNRVPELSSVEYLRQSILEPSAYVIEGYSHQMGRIHSVLLNEKEINDLVAFMLTQ
jgi:hypothetical protein